MKRPHPFRFFKVKSKRGSVYYVVYDHDPSHPKSTGVVVNPKDRRNRYEPAGYDEAVAWAYANLETVRRGSNMTLREFAESFFDPQRCPWAKRMIKKGRTFGAYFLPARRGWLLNYILPRFGSLPLDMITTKMIDEWLLDLDSIKKGTPLSPASLDKILHAMRRVLGEAQYQDCLQENVAERIEPFDVGDIKRRLPFSIEEIRSLFPAELNQALSIWQTLSWYAFFLMQWTCGLRPGETAGFMLSDWIKEYHGALISRSIEAGTLRIKGLKTEHSGMVVKSVIFCDSLEWVLQLLENGGAPRDDLLFHSQGKSIGPKISNNHFKQAARCVGLQLAGRTQYCLRHTFYTEALKRLPEKDVEKMAGHRSLRKEYDHRKGMDFLKAAQPLREVINELSAVRSE